MKFLAYVLALAYATLWGMSLQLLYKIITSDITVNLWQWENVNKSYLLAILVSFNVLLIMVPLIMIKCMHALTEKEKIITLIKGIIFTVITSICCYVTAKLWYLKIRFENDVIEIYNKSKVIITRAFSPEQKLEWFLEIRNKVKLPDIHWEKFMSTININEIGTFRDATLAVKNYINGIYKPQMHELAVLNDSIAGCHNATNLGLLAYTIFWGVFIIGGAYTCYLNFKMIKDTVKQILDFFKSNDDQSFGEKVSDAFGEVANNMLLQKQTLLDCWELARIDKALFKFCFKLARATDGDMLALKIQMNQIVSDLAILNAKNALHGEALGALMNINQIAGQLALTFPAGV